MRTKDVTDGAAKAGGEDADLLGRYMGVLREDKRTVNKTGCQTDVDDSLSQAPQGTRRMTELALFKLVCFHTFTAISYQLSSY